jgi:hypothetical protein
VPLKAMNREGLSSSRGKPLESESAPLQAYDAACHQAHHPKQSGWKVPSSSPMQVLWVKIFSMVTRIGVKNVASRIAPWKLYAEELDHGFTADRSFGKLPYVTILCKT